MLHEPSSQPSSAPSPASIAAELGSFCTGACSAPDRVTTRLRSSKSEVTPPPGVLAPAGTPRPIVARLNSELVKAMHSPEMKERLAGIGTDPVTSTPEAFAAYMQAEIGKWGDVIRKAGLKAD